MKSFNIKCVIEYHMNLRLYESSKFSGILHIILSTMNFLQASNAYEFHYKIRSTIIKWIGMPSYSLRSRGQATIIYWDVIRYTLWSRSCNEVFCDYLANGKSISFCRHLMHINECNKDYIIWQVDASIIAKISRICIPTQYFIE